MKTLAISLAATLAILLSHQSFAQNIGADNFTSRKAIAINNSPANLQLSDFSFANEFRNSSFKSVTNLSWKNTGSKAITAFEVIIRYYDPFNRPMSDGGRWLITGHDSGNWAALKAGESSSDGLIGYRETNALTAIVYVRAIRFADDTVWSANLTEVENQVKQKLPALKDVGPLDPGPQAKEK